jgi:chlorite dismutase
MPELTPRALNHFAFLQFKDSYYSSSAAEKQQFHNGLIHGLQQASQNFYLYQVYPAQAGVDFLIWSAVEAANPSDTAKFLHQFACATNPYRSMVAFKEIYWGLTKPSQYTRTRSNQEIDPFQEQRKQYLVVYPFVKTAEWYLMSREARQGMMNEHIRIGKQYPQILQLLLYSFGIQDQEFLVVYEMDDLSEFSDLVYELRDSEARRYTLRDTPLFTAIYHPADETLGLWE